MLTAILHMRRNVYVTYHTSVQTVNRADKTCETKRGGRKGSKFRVRRLNFNFLSPSQTRESPS